MKHVFIVVCLTALVLFSCNNGAKHQMFPDIKIELTTERFEKKLFDTTSASLTNYLQQLQNSSSSFTGIFINQILGADPKWPADTTAQLM